MNAAAWPETDPVAVVDGVDVEDGAAVRVEDGVGVADAVAKVWRAPAETQALPAATAATDLVGEGVAVLLGDGVAVIPAAGSTDFSAAGAVIPVTTKPIITTAPPAATARLRILGEAKRAHDTRPDTKEYRAVTSSRRPISTTHAPNPPGPVERDEISNRTARTATTQVERVFR